VSLAMQSPYEPPLNRRWDPLLAARSEAAPVSVLDSVRFVFDDPQWKNNVGIGLVFSLIPLVGPIALGGWLCEIHQRLVRGDPRPTPKLDFADLGHYLTRGVVPFLVQLVVLAPLWLLFMAGYFITAFGVIAAVSATGQPLVGVLIVVAALVCMMAVFVAAGLVGTSAQTRAELTESFTESLSPGAVLGYMLSTWSQILVKGFLFTLLSMGIALAGLALLCVGVYPAAVVIQIAAVHLRWQIYRYHVDRGGEPISIKEPQVPPSEAMRAPLRSYSS
jgi:hypothetical protein